MLKIFMVSIVGLTFLFSSCSSPTDPGDCSAVQCSGQTKSNDRCKNRTTNCSGYCYLHD